VDSVTTVELIGYVASALIVLSLLMASVLRLRLINLVGAAVFTVYGVLIGSWPVVLTNAAIVVIDVYYLAIILRDLRREGYFEVVQVPTASPILARFVAFHGDEISRFEPGFPGLREGQLAWMILRDAVPVGAVVGERDDDTLDLLLDHVVPEHRDLTPGEVLYGRSGAFHDVGISRVRAHANTPGHRRYLERMGFVPVGERWERPVGPADITA